MRLSWLTLLAGVSLSGCHSDVPDARTQPETTVSSSKIDQGSAPPTPSTVTPVDFEPKRVTLVEKAMGTKIQIQTFTTPQFDEAQVKDKLWKSLVEIRRLETLMTTWSEDSEISRINRAAGKDAVKVGPETLSVIEKSQWISQKSEGVFDISFEAMHGLWKFDQDLEASVPTKAAVEQARKLIDYRQIQIDDAASTIRLSRPGMRISLGGIAKGYAVDAAAKVLESEGLRAYFVQAGGDLFIRGRKPDGQPFHVGVRDPRGKDDSDVFATLDVEDHAFSTAGDYERGFVKDGKRYHHIIDPRTGYPATASRSVTVWAKDAFTADAIDDAVFILGPEKGLALVESLEGVGVVIVDKNNKVWISKRLEGIVHSFREPTDGI